MYEPKHLTTNDHLEIGLALGFPQCCVTEWVADCERGETGMIISRGFLDLGFREEDVFFNGRLLPNGIGRRGDLIRYVPCTVCAQKNNTYENPAYRRRAWLIRS